MITTLSVILLVTISIISTISLYLEFYIRSKLHISLRELLESVSILYDIGKSKKHKTLEFVTNTMIRCKIQDTDRLLNLRQEIQGTLDKINRIPCVMLSEEDLQIKDSLTKSSFRIREYLYSV